MLRLQTWIAALACALAAATAQAQIRIGQTAGFTGQVAAGVKETTAGAKLYFDAVNARGGIGGERVELVSLDDNFDTKLAAQNAQTLASDPKVVALFLSRGTPQTQAMLPVIEKAQIALVAPSTGAMVLHSPVLPLVFNVRASYQREAARAVEHLFGIAVTRIAVLHPNDSFGNDAVIGATAGFAKNSAKPVFVGQFDQKATDFGALAAKLKPIDPQAVLFIGSAQSVADGTRILRAAGLRAQIVTLSNNASSGFIALLGANARGTVISQVFPNERSIASLLIKEILDSAKAAHVDAVSPAFVEGYAGAKVLVEGLRRAGRHPTRAAVITALESISNYDLGGMKLSYSNTDHTGLDFVDLSIVDAQGILRR